MHSFLKWDAAKFRKVMEGYLEFKKKIENNWPEATEKNRIKLTCQLGNVHIQSKIQILVFALWSCQICEPHWLLSTMYFWRSVSPYPTTTRISFENASSANFLIAWQLYIQQNLRNTTDASTSPGSEEWTVSAHYGGGRTINPHFWHPFTLCVKFQGLHLIQQLRIACISQNSLYLWTYPTFFSHSITTKNSAREHSWCFWEIIYQVPSSALELCGCHNSN